MQNYQLPDKAKRKKVLSVEDMIGAWHAMHRKEAAFSSRSRIALHSFITSEDM